VARIRKDLAWLVQLEEKYGTRKIVAHVVVPQESGELHSPDAFWRFNSEHKDFADLTVSAYLGEMDYADGRDRQPGKVWGLGRQFTPHHVEHADHARDMARILTRIDKGLQAAQTDSGYLSDGDYPGHLARIGQTLGVTKYYMRAGQPIFATAGSGERYTSGDITKVQYWLREVSRLAEEKPSMIAQLIRA
jgi:hypothetical protein